MGKKILLVDDDDELRDIIRAGLQEHGYSVFHAQNGDEFREQALAVQPDLIILDIMLGEDNGVFVYERLVTQGLNSKTPVVFLSALADERVVSHGGPGRTFALLRKPIRLRELREEINRLLVPA